MSQLTEETAQQLLAEFRRIRGKTNLLQPNWISEEDACKWLGVTKTYMYRLRGEVNYTHLTPKRVPMYDKNDIEELLTKNSFKAHVTQK